jgi:N-acetylneuraminic acid mutarotase
MKGDFSRFPGGYARYGGVWMQQGRVQLDADWNDQVALSAWRDRLVARDAMGGSGAPAADPGFRVTLRSGVLLEAPGQSLSIDPPPDGPLADPAAPFTVEVLATLRPGGRGGPLLHAPGICAAGVEADGTVWLSMGRGRLSAPRAVRPRAATWIAAAWDGTAAALYVDGALLAAGALRPEGSGGGTLTLGAGPDPEGGAASLDGLLGEARLWRGALGAGRLRDLAAGGPVGGEPDLAGWWPLDEGAGETARDAAGGCHARVGGPRPPRWVPAVLHVGAGRYWVDGTVAANARDVSVAAQPDLPGVRPPATGDYLVYLDVWERWLSPVEDPQALEVALDGADTTGRTRTVWQVRTLPVHGMPPEADPGCAPDGSPWTALLPSPRGEGRMAARAGELPPSDNRLYRVEIHHPGGAYGWPRPAGARGVEVVSVDAASRRIRLRGWAVDGAGWEAGQPVELWSRATESAGTPGALARVTAVDAAAHTLALDTMPDLSADDGLRVRPLASWTWSRDNGSVVYGIASLDTATGEAGLRDLGRPGQVPSVGDWMEALDDVHTLQGRPGPLCRVKAVAAASQTVTLDPPPRGVSPEAARHPLLRRWEKGPGAGPPDQVVRTGWTSVDSVAQVRFDPALYRTGDFWTIPVRELAEDGVEWPRDGNAAAALPPQGIAHAYAPLALVRHDAGGARVTDLRRIFSPAGGGGVMRHGPQRMQGPLSVAGDVTTGGVFRGRLADGMVRTPALADAAVTTEKLADGSVTVEKLAFAAGGLPAGACVLGERAEAPPGFRAMGAVLELRVGTPAWVSRGAAPLADPAGARAAALDGVLYAVSGDGSDLWAWDERGGWERRAPPVYPRRGAALCAHGGRLLLAGGWGGDGPLDRVEAYDPSADAWRSCAPLPTARGWAGAASTGERMYVFGGRRKSWLGAFASAANEAYDPGADRWTECRDLLMRRERHGAAALDGQLFAVGGDGRLRNEERLTAAAEAYDPATDRWRRVGSLPEKRAQMGMAVLDGTLYVAGGRTAESPATASALRYDPGADRWSPGPPLPAAVRDLALVALDDVLYCVGGQNDGGHPVGAFDEMRLALRLYPWCREP